MDFLRQQNKAVAGDRLTNQTLAKGKHVVVIGGGDTGSDCVGTSNRHGAASVTQFELMPQPPESENKSMTWPYWPLKLRTSSSHEEGCERDWSVTTKLLKGSNGKVEKLVGARVEWFKDEATGQMKMREVEGSEFEIKADLVLLAMGFVSPVQTCWTPSAWTATRAATCAPTPTTTAPASRRCSPPATRAAASRWWYGPSAKAASARARWTPS